MLPVVLDDGVTSQSTLTRVITLTSDIQPSPTLSHHQLNTHTFVDLDTEFDSQVDGLIINKVKQLIN